jgi:hypothetical protein
MTYAYIDPASGDWSTSKPVEVPTGSWTVEDWRALRRRGGSVNSTPKLVLDIIEALTRRGEDFTDGECLDEVWALLTDAGYRAELERSLEANQQ